MFATGTGDADELKQNLSDSIVAYGIIRDIEIIDQSTTVKFCFIHWLGSKVAPTTKAKITTHKGAVEQLFSVS